MDTKLSTKNKIQLLGIGLIILSYIKWPCFFVIPFCPASNIRKAAVCAEIVIVTEIIFWIGIFLVGAELAQKIKNIIANMFSLHRKSKE